MLYLLTQHLTALYSGFNVFSYLTLRAILACMTSLVFCLLIGPSMIARLSRYQIGQVVRDDGPKSHLPKAGTPTMGGALILVAVLFGTLMWANIRDRFVWMVLGVTFAFGLIGFYDDYLKLVVRNSRGLIPRWKYLWQTVVGLCAAAVLYYTAQSPAETTLFLPFVKRFAEPLSAVSFITLSYLMIVGMSNAVNLTDGLDGLAIMPAVMLSAAQNTRTSPARDSVSSGSTPIRRRCSWVTWVHSRSVPRSASSPSSCARNSWRWSWAAYSYWRPPR